MKHFALLVCCLTVVSALAATKKTAKTTLIASAIKSAPASVAKGANNPTTPGPDPMCLDANAMEWAKAWMGHQTPPAGKVGFMYMLAGGTDASNMDPLVVGADQAFYDSYPKNPDPDTSVPYIMWAGTPYQHLMAPVK